MNERLKRLRALPEEKKQGLALAVAFSITGLIFAVWLGTFLYRLSREEPKVPTASETAPSPFEALRESIQSISQSASALKKAMSGAPVSEAPEPAASSSDVASQPKEGFFSVY